MKYQFLKTTYWKRFLFIILISVFTTMVTFENVYGRINIYGLFFPFYPNLYAQTLNAYSHEFTSNENRYSKATMKKITFDISEISPEGLIGESNSLSSVSYEFCIPANDEYLTEIQTINPEINYYSQSRGRIGCNRNQYLCIGDTHNPRWKEILISIASLDYVERIDRFYGE